MLSHLDFNIMACGSHVKVITQRNNSTFYFICKLYLLTVFIENTLTYFCTEKEDTNKTLLNT